MGIQFSVVRYLVHEITDTILHDTPAIGAYDITRHERNHGEYFFRRTAERKRRNLEKALLEKGWKPDPNNKHHLSHRDDDTFYSIEKF